MAGPTSDATVRLAVFRACLRDGMPPSVEQLMGELQIPRADLDGALERLDAARHLKLVAGTHRVLMAYPFSGVATPYQVRLRDDRRFYANCAWDAIAFHSMLHETVRIDSYCHHCGDRVSFRLKDGALATDGATAPLVYFGRPAAEWWNDIISTCANTMVFFRDSEHFEDWRGGLPDESGVSLTVETVLRLSDPLYGDRMALEFCRPSRDRLVELFRSLGLDGPFWQI